jgi:hypothetical protein
MCLHTSRVPKLIVVSHAVMLVALSVRRPDSDTVLSKSSGMHCPSNTLSIPHGLQQVYKVSIWLLVF